MDQSYFRQGLKDGLPIGIGYFAVAFSLGVFAGNVGIKPIQGLIASLLTNASAGEYAGFMVIATNATYMHMIIMTIIASLRYLLMSAVLSQRCDENITLLHRLILSFYITDEIFAITIAKSKKIIPEYTFGAILPATTLWGLGTLCGILAGNILPDRIISGLSVALYGMFIAIIIPPCKEDKAVKIAVITSFILSFLSTYYLPILNNLDSGSRTIILTILISLVVAKIAPRGQEDA